MITHCQYAVKELDASSPLVYISVIIIGNVFG
jgi:hypothetical protein